VIREFRLDDAPRAAALLHVLAPTWFRTERRIRHKAEKLPPRARRRSWVALAGDDVVGADEAGERFVRARGFGLRARAAREACDGSLGGRERARLDLARER
jgi:hypothetical protein